MRPGAAADGRGEHSRRDARIVHLLIVSNQQPG